MRLPSPAVACAEGNFNHSKGHRTKRKALMRRTFFQFVLASFLLLLPTAFAVSAQQQQPVPPDQPSKPPANIQDQKQPPAKTADQPPAKAAAQPQNAPSAAPDNTTFDPFHAEQDVEVGTFYMHKGDVDAAIPRFEHAIALRANFAKPRLLLAECYEKKHEPATAAKYLKEYLKVYPDAPDRKSVEKKIEKLSSK